MAILTTYSRRRIMLILHLHPADIRLLLTICIVKDLHLRLLLANILVLIMVLLSLTVPHHLLITIRTMPPHLLSTIMGTEGMRLLARHLLVHYLVTTVTTTMAMATGRHRQDHTIIMAPLLLNQAKLQCQHRVTMVATPTKRRTRMRMSGRTSGRIRSSRISSPLESSSSSTLSITLSIIKNISSSTKKEESRRKTDMVVVATREAFTLMQTALLMLHHLWTIAMAEAIANIIPSSRLMMRRQNTEKYIEPGSRLSDAVFA
mmetsp:Transcript_6523/g.13732  ORF Transcript_6523/g.13732 Transcript_6523/m.13732 type:complete len:261 (-) Transcript_6523:71-853(-)